MRKPLMTFETKIKICLWKAYFETGFSVLNYAKYPVIALGAYDIVKNNNVERTLIGSLIFFILCFVIGYYWYKTDFAKAAAEVGNRYNKLALEIRKKLKTNSK